MKIKSYESVINLNKQLIDLMLKTDADEVIEWTKIGKYNESL